MFCVSTILVSFLKAVTGMTRSKHQSIYELRPSRSMHDDASSFTSLSSWSWTRLDRLRLRRVWTIVAFSFDLTASPLIARTVR